MSQLNVDTIKKADGTGNLSVPAETGTVVTTASPSLGRRNLIINGAMQVAQRGTSFTGLGNASSQYLLDRFRFNENGDPTYEFTATQDSNGPDGFGSSLKIDITTADTSLGTNDTLRIRTLLEAQNLQSLAYGTSSASSVTLSFYVKSSTTGTYKVFIYSEDGDRSNAKAYTIDTADTWERKTLTFSGDASGTINNDTGRGFDIEFFLAAGTDWTSGTDPDGTWEGHTKANVAAGQTVNLASSTSNYWQITGVQLEVGDTATPFEHRSYGEELALCQRYYHRQGDNTVSNGYEGFGACAAYSTTSARMVYSLPVQMRTTPSFTYNGSFQMTTGESINSSGAMSLADGGGNPVVCINIDSTSTLTKWYAYSVRSNNDIDAYFAFDAEL